MSQVDFMCPQRGGSCLYVPVVLFRGGLAEWTSGLMLFSGLVTGLSLLGWQHTIQHPPFLEIGQDIYRVSKKLVLLKPLFVFP